MKIKIDMIGTVKYMFDLGEHIPVDFGPTIIYKNGTQFWNNNRAHDIKSIYAYGIKSAVGAKIKIQE